MNILFSFGIPKSGTTFLQMILNAHPEISCPSEHQFDALANELKRVFDQYNQLITQIDGNTARQGAATFQSSDMDKLFIQIVKIAAKRGANSKQVKWYGLNDNAIIQKVSVYAALFPEAKFICIVRDPRSVTVSSWHHNIRIHSSLSQKTKDLNQWSRVVGHIWQRDMIGIHQLSEDPKFGGKLYHCRYEDLLSSPVQALREICRFLNVDSNEQILNRIIEATRFDHFTANPFFREGKTDSWKQELSPSMLQTITNQAGSLMKIYGYL